MSRDRVSTTETIGMRYPSLDALRATSMLFIVVWHGMLAYAPLAGQSWPVSDPARSAIWDFIIWFPMGVTLRVFFVMSGFFCRSLLMKLGLRRFAAHRLKRVGIPLLLGGFLFHLWMTGKLGFSPYHLWFLEDLLLISLVIASLVCWFSRTGADEGQSIAERFAANLSETAAVFLLVVLSMIAMYVAPSPGAIDPWNLSQNMNRDPAVTVFYAAFFCYGWFLNRNPGLLRIMERYALRILVVGALLRLGSLVILLTLDRSARVIPMVTVTCCYSWFMVLGSIGLFQRVIRTDRPILRYITDMSYFFYFAHPLPLITMQRALICFELPAALKFASAIFVTMGMLLITYEYAVRYTPMGTLLNGKRRRAAGPRSGAWSLRPL